MSLIVNNEKVKLLLLVLPIYAILTSTLYLSGYWNVFDINIFEYISINEIVKLSIYPLGTYIFAQLIFSVIVLLFFPSLFKPIDDDAMKSQGLGGYKLLIWMLKIIFLFVLILIIYMAFFSDYKHRWFVVGGLVGAIVLNMVSLKSFQKNFSSPFTPHVLGMLLIITSVAYGYGHSKALNFEDMVRVSSVNNVDTKMILVGRTDGYVFLLPENFQSEKKITLKVLSVKSIDSIVYQLN